MRRISYDGRVGRYLLQEPLAKGGMAELFLGQREGRTEKPCVVKRIRTELVTNPVFIDLFRHEARLGSLVTHPAIAKTLDHGEHGGDPFLVLEYFAGEDLSVVAKKLKTARAPLPLDVALHVGIGAAEALHHLHELKSSQGKRLNVVHRDISPCNLLLGYDGIVKLLDLGVAASDGMPRGPAASQVHGKLEYMAPERTVGKLSDRTADIWSLGVVLFELFTGQPLFRGKTDLEVGMKIHNLAIPSPRSLRPDLPANLEATLLSTLQRDPSKRPATAEAVRRELLRSYKGSPGYNAKNNAKFLTGLFGQERAELKLSRLKPQKAPKPVTATRTPSGWSSSLSSSTEAMARSA